MAGRFDLDVRHAAAWHAHSGRSLTSPGRYRARSRFVPPLLIHQPDLMFRPHKPGKHVPREYAVSCRGSSYIGSYTSNVMPSAAFFMSDMITVERKEFEGFLAENQKLLDRSRVLVSKIDELENENRQLRDELQATRARLGSLESGMADNSRQADESLRKAREIMSRLAKEADKRIST